MKVSLFQLLVICCIVSVAACEKEKVHSKRGKILGGTFISPNDLSVDSKTMQVKRGNINGGSFVGGAFNFQRSIMTESKRSDDKEKRGKILGGTFISPNDLSVDRVKRADINDGSFVGGAFNFKRSNMTESKRSDDKEKHGNINDGSFVSGTFNFKRSNMTESKRSDDKEKHGNINDGSFVSGTFNFKRSNMTESKRSDDKEKRGNINGGSFVGGRFNFKRSKMTESKKLLPILPNDFTGVIHLKPGLAIGSGSTIGLNVSSFQHTYKFEKFMIYSMVELKTKEERRNVLVEAEKKRRHGLKEGKKGLEMGTNSVKEAINMVSRFKTALPKGFKI